MWSKALTYQLKPGRYFEYKKAHDEVWPELAQAMTDNQVNMVIHHRAHGGAIRPEPHGKCRRSLARIHGDDDDHR